MDPKQDQHADSVRCETVTAGVQCRLSAEPERSRCAFHEQAAGATCIALADDGSPCAGERSGADLLCEVHLGHKRARLDRRWRAGVAPGRRRGPRGADRRRAAGSGSALLIPEGLTEHLWRRPPVDGSDGS